MNRIRADMARNHYVMASLFIVALASLGVSANQMSSGGLVNGLVNNVLGSPEHLLGKPLAEAHSLAGGLGASDPLHTLTGGLGLTSGSMNGLASGLAAATSNLVSPLTKGLGSVTGSSNRLVESAVSGGSGILNGPTSLLSSPGASAAVAGAHALVADSAASHGGFGGFGGIGQGLSAMSSASEVASSASRASTGALIGSMSSSGNAEMAQAAGAASAMMGSSSSSGSAEVARAAGAASALMGSGSSSGGAEVARAAGAASALMGSVSSSGTAEVAKAAGAASAVRDVASSSGALAAETMSGSLSNHMLSRQALAADALINANGEAALAGADMVAHGANNAHSAALASNAYRQAKLATARDRVNIAGTVQNSARISDAAIATHDAATKAEDSLLGSELAVDSAATVLDSDAAYIPPVTNSLLRSLPYGRLGLRNIIPKPLTYPSAMLPDVWLNGNPANYLTLPFRAIPYGAGAAVSTGASGQLLASGYMLNNQPLVSNNGILFSNLVLDPTLAYLNRGIYGVMDSSILPIIANGQLQAHDEVAMANLMTNQQLNGLGSLGTYYGYGRLNVVPLLTGSVSDANLAATTTIGTTYPIGSALVIEPRDSYFQDYIDNASSRQNFDDRQQ